jgi:pyridoxamine 5'-phosphate oxidase
VDPRQLADLRRSYADAGLSEGELAGDPVTQFEAWLSDAVAAGVKEPNAMVLATAAPADGAWQPSARTVLLKAVDARGFVFFTNYGSRKGTELDGNPAASLVFPWYDLERQVVVVGRVDRVSREESRAYFETRPRGSRLGAWASRQSQPVQPVEPGTGRAGIEAAYAETAERFPGEVPLPDFWGGYRLAPQTVEFWQGRPSRLHDRLQYVREGEGWRVRRLEP